MAQLNDLLWGLVITLGLGVIEHRCRKWCYFIVDCPMHGFSIAVLQGGAPQLAKLGYKYYFTRVDEWG